LEQGPTDPGIVVPNISEISTILSEFDARHQHLGDKIIVRRGVQARTKLKFSFSYKVVLIMLSGLTSRSV
jgi:hypothetical protein